MSQDSPPLKDPFALDGEEPRRQSAAETGPEHTPAPGPGVGGQPLRDPFARDATPVPTTPVPTSASPFVIPSWRYERGSFADEEAPRAPTANAGASAEASASSAVPAVPTRRPALHVLPGGVPGADLSGREATMPGAGTGDVPSLDVLAGREATMPLSAGGGAFPGLTGAEPTMPGGGGDLPALLSGREATMPGLGGAASSSVPLDLLSGREVTMPGMGGAIGGGGLTGAEPTMPGLGAHSDALTGAEPTMPGLGRGESDTPRTMTGGRSSTSATLAGGGGKPRTGFGKPKTGAGSSGGFDDAWHLQGRQGPHTGQLWGDWEIGGVLGEGGMGTVYRAKQKSLNRRVALKVLASNLASDSKLLQRFQLEARTASLLASPNVVQVFAAGEWEGLHFFVMEYVEGRDLYDVIKERQSDGRPFAPDEAADIVIQAAKGLAEAGRHGIVHRDIKPPNLMMAKGGLVKVADFGIVKVMGESSLTMAGQAVGTPSYVSPEQGRGEQDIDQRSDLYSLGVVFYELLCGRKPYEGSTPNALIYQHCYGEPPLPRDINPAISEQYQAVVLRCLQKKPENRYATALDLITDLEAIRNGNLFAVALANHKLGTGADEAKRENMSWAQRHLLKLVAGVAVAALAGGIGLYQLTANSNEANEAAAKLRQQADQLYTTLSHLDKLQSISKDAQRSLDEYVKLPIADLAKAAIWRAKLAKVAELTHRLKPLDDAEIPLALRHSAPPDLFAYQQLVGIEDPQAVNWKERLEGLGTLERDLRVRLREIDQLAELTQVRASSFAASLRQLAVMAGSDDPLVKRVAARLAEFDARRDRYLANLGALDKPGAVVTETQRGQLQAELAELTRILGTEDERLSRWNLMLTSNAERIAQLRAKLRRLDPLELVPSSVELELGKDLAALKELVDENDPELRGWKAKLAATAAEIDALRKRLARLDQVPVVPVAEVHPLSEVLTALRALVSDIDPDVSRWDTALRASRSRHDELRGALARLDKPEALTLDEQRLLSAVRTEFAALGGLGENQDAAAKRRLDDERETTAARAERLKLIDGKSSLTAGLRQDLDTFSRQAGAQHDDVKRWSAKRERIDALRIRLLPLDAAAPVPSDAVVLLDTLVGEVGDSDDEVVRWRAKVAAVNTALAALAPLDRAQPVPPGTRERLDTLGQLVGASDTRYLGWKSRLDRIDALKVALGRLPATYGQSPAAHADAHARLTELVLLVSDADADVRAWASRQAVLDGPGRPAWASASGRDDFGLWAQLTVGKTEQRFRYLPPGSFLVGSPVDEPGHEPDELQVTLVLARACWLADTECTQALWAAAGGGTPSRHHSEERPVERVSWNDAHSFCARLAEQITAVVRLPTEAEWEYACRAGGSGPFTTGRSDQTDPLLMTWSSVNTNASKEIKLRVPNPLGLYDLHGNVWEWCEDRHGAYPTTATTDHIGRDGALRVVRGGSWGDSLNACRAANRAGVKPTLRSAYIGLRLAIDVTWSDGALPDGRALLADIALNGGSGKADTRTLTIPTADGGELTLTLSQPLRVPAPVVAPAPAQPAATPEPAAPLPAVAPLPIIPVPVDATPVPALPVSEAPLAPTPVVEDAPTTPAQAVPVVPAETAPLAETPDSAPPASVIAVPTPVSEPATAPTAPGSIP